MRINLTLPFYSWLNFTIVPYSNLLGAFQHFQMFSKFIMQRSVFV